MSTNDRREIPERLMTMMMITMTTVDPAVPIAQNAERLRG